jgi:hypothetical protein
MGQIANAKQDDICQDKTRVRARQYKTRQHEARQHIKYRFGLGLVLGLGRGNGKTRQTKE